MKNFRFLIVLPLLCAVGLCAQASQAAEPAARPLLEELQRLGLDPAQGYTVDDVYLRRDAIRLHLHHGTLVFFQPVAGRVTGAVFEGTGEVLVLPPDSLERQQLARFTGSPILTESFASAYFRFSDATFDELRAQIRAGQGQPTAAPELVERWTPIVASLNRGHSARLLLDFLPAPPAPYFYAGINGQRLGAFDIVLDHRRPEPILVGQLRWAAGQRFYDVWCSFGRGELLPPSPAAHTTAYRIDATITAEHELEATTEVDLELSEPGPHILFFELSRFLSVQEVTDLGNPAGSGTDTLLEFFQNVTLTAEEARYRGSDVVVVLLPPSPPAPPGTAEKRTLRFRYRGQVISDVGGGVLFVGARGSWYPSLGNFSRADYQLRFRTPRTLELVTAGTLRDIREEGDWKESRWATEVPLPVVGFNVGDYESREVERGPVRIIVYANRQLEPQLAQAARPPVAPLPFPLPPGSRNREAPPGVTVETPPPQPSALLEQVGNDVGDALAAFTELFGPFPYPQLKVSQIPGSFGQGFPGLLYLPTFSFIPDADQVRMGLSERSRELFSKLTPAHETAHQWWGNWVQLPDYRDQWLGESLAGYSALLYLERQPGGQAVVREWLERYRKDLLVPGENGEPVEGIGALALGLRLNSSRSPNGYVQLIYSKGPWVLHMLRELLRDPRTGSDAVFLGVLRELAAHGGERPLTTAEFQRRLEAALPPYADLEKSGRLDWFFQQWVYETGIPRYKLSWQLRGSPQRGWRVEGTIEQSGVPQLFIMPVPLYAQAGNQVTRLGTVVVTGDKVAFRFPVKAKPEKLLLDPQLTLLCQVE